MNTPYRSTISLRQWGLVFIVALLMMMIAGCLGATNNDTSNKRTETSYQTTQVQRGDIASETSGSGVLSARKMVDLKFPVSGTLDKLNVRIGDQVKQGQMLASLAEIDQLQLEVDMQQLAAAEAEEALNELLEGQEEILAQALADRATAVAAYEEAKSNLHKRGDARCDPQLTEEYYYEYLYANNEFEDLEYALETGYSAAEDQYVRQRMNEVGDVRHDAYANWKYCEGYSEVEILESTAAMELAEADMKIAQADYEQALANQGVDAEAIDLAQAQLNEAQLLLAQAQHNLAGATLSAPMDATVIDITASVGEAVGADPVIRLADMNDTYLEVNVDETDLAIVQPGCSALVSFDAFPERTFTGTVSALAPVLGVANNISSVIAFVSLDQTQLNPRTNLPLNLHGTVDITCQSAQDALVLPASAIHQDTDDSEYVYVLTGNDQVIYRSIETGVSDAVWVEVVSGLELGETVILDQISSGQ
ncbi:MAG: efflux RND transporter periplasmic adaptor subunit [Anaerolineae bacterium]|nr:efflux RND transporter periplasmic adaptor subunit [Anaerolineae bacterium]